MKKLLVAGFAAAAFCGAPVLAADLPVKAPPRAYVAPAPVFTWTGCYIGLNTGGGWSGFYHTNSDGWVGGGQIGCDSQLNNNWVVGLQVMWDGADVTGTKNVGPGSLDWIDGKVSSFGTVAAKLGYLVNPTLQFYGKAGWGWVSDRATYNCGNGFCALGNSASISRTASGFDAGVGFTWMFQRNWDLFVEYDYMWLNNVSESFPLAGVTGLGNSQQNFQKLLIGIDYRFDMMGKAPVVSAKY